MHLNLPIFEQLSACKNLLIAGMGGGFDIFCGLPVYFDLKSRGINVHLANLSFSNIVNSNNKEALCTQSIQLTDTLVGVTAETKSLNTYFPELYLAQWFKETRNEEVTIWCFGKTGTLTLVADYRKLVEHLSIDGILLIDGGVDSLSRGDETEMGTVIEDSFSLIAVSELTQVPIRLMGCLGFGAERDISYAHVLENIASLAAVGGFLGSCSLVKQMEVYQAYENALLYVQNHPRQEPSVINSSVISAVQGHYGDYHLTAKTTGSKLWISPLMPIYWFFDLPTVVKHNLFLSQFRTTDSVLEAMQVLYMMRRIIPERTATKIPLS